MWRWPSWEKALEALEGTGGVEVDATKKALVKAKAAAHEKPITEQIAECKSFIDRAEKRLVKLDAERESENALLEEGRARLACLEAHVAASGGFLLPSRLWEGFVSNTVEEAALWVRCRQQEMEDAIAKGSEGMFPGWRT